MNRKERKEAAERLAEEIMELFRNRTQEEESLEE
jgi:hypothetical protein